MRPRGERSIVVLADGGFDLLEAKTAVGLIRYGRDPVVAVVDRVHAGQRAADVVGLGADIPVVATVPQAVRLAPQANTLLLGTAPRGGVLPASWRGHILDAIRAGLDVMSGLHDFLGDDPELAEAAHAAGVELRDVRRAPGVHRVADTRAHGVAATVVLTIGSDCSVGMMTAALEIDTEARRRGRMSTFVPTGQTGVMIAGWGVAVDEVPADFAAGAAEDLVMEAALECSEPGDVIVVEGQGALIHPGYSGVTLSLLHGTAPDALVLCHQPGRATIRRYGVPLPPLPRLIELHQAIAAPVKPARVIAVALNTVDLSEAAARAAIERTEAQTGLPATDPVRFGAARLMDAIERHTESKAPKRSAVVQQV